MSQIVFKYQINVKHLILKLKYTQKKKCIFLDQHYSLEQNMKLKESIESDEYGTLNAVKGLLRRYEKYRVKSIWMYHSKYAFLIQCK